MSTKSTLLCFLLIFGLAAGQLIEIVEPTNNNHQPDKPGPVAPGENDEDDAIIISDPSKFPDPERVTENIFIPDPETERPIGSDNNLSNGGFQIAPDYESGDPVTQKYEGDNGEIPIENWDLSRHTTTRKPQNKPQGLGGIWGSIVGGWQDAVHSNKALENVVDSVVDVGGKYLNASKNTADKILDAKQEVLEKVHVDGTLVNATKQVVDKIFDKKQEALDNFHTKNKGIMPPDYYEQGDDDGDGDEKDDPTYTWNPPNDVASDIYDFVDFESDNRKEEYSPFNWPIF